MNKKLIKIIGIVIVIIIILCYFLVPSFKSNINNYFVIFTNQDKLKSFVASYGVFAMLISFLLMIFQSIIAPLPAFIITLVNAALFGWVLGAILSWASAMVGAALCFFIARIYGRDLVEKLVSKKLLNESNKYFDEYGTKTILVTRLLPFVSFDLISYAAGLTNMKFKSFLIATGIGQLPATIIYSYVGGNLSGGAQKMFIALLVLFSIAIVITIIKQIYQKKRKNNA